MIKRPSISTPEQKRDFVLKHPGVPESQLADMMYAADLYRPSTSKCDIEFRIRRIRRTYAQPYEEFELPANRALS